MARKRHCVKWSGRSKKRKCRFGVVRKGRRKGSCLKHRRPKGAWHSAGRSGGRIYVKRGR